MGAPPAAAPPRVPPAARGCVAPVYRAPSVAAAQRRRRAVTPQQGLPCAPRTTSTASFAVLVKQFTPVGVSRVGFTRWDWKLCEQGLEAPVPGAPNVSRRAKSVPRNKAGLTMIGIGFTYTAIMQQAGAADLAGCAARLAGAAFCRATAEDKCPRPDPVCIIGRTMSQGRIELDITSSPKCTASRVSAVCGRARPGKRRHLAIRCWVCIRRFHATQKPK